MGSKYQLELDHIFPYSRLKKAGYDRENRIKYSLAQEFTNRAILTQVANRGKSDMNAGDYLASVKKKFPKALELQCIPTDESLWQIENYERFLEARRELLAKHLNDFLKKITETDEVVTTVSLAEMIDKGESDELEFKSTLRWDIKESRVNKKLEEVILKSVAAFANSQGGTLLIGVDDEGRVLGLEHDYLSLGDVDRDKFELHLRNLLNQQFGTGVVTSKIDIMFHEVEENEVCQIDVASVKEPLILKLKDKNGQLIEKFYVRSGNSSQEIPLSELHSYMKERFHP